MRIKKETQMAFMYNRRTREMMIHRANEWFKQNGEHLRAEFAKHATNLAKGAGIALASLTLLLAPVACDNGTGGPNPGPGPGHGPGPNPQPKSNAQIAAEFAEFVRLCGLGQCGMGEHGDWSRNQDHILIYARIGHCSDMIDKNVRASGLLTYSQPALHTTSITLNNVVVTDKPGGGDRGSVAITPIGYSGTRTVEINIDSGPWLSPQ